jgi:hypothetical protein
VLIRTPAPPPPPPPPLPPAEALPPFWALPPDTRPVMVCVLAIVCPTPPPLPPPVPLKRPALPLEPLPVPADGELVGLDSPPAPPPPSPCPPCPAIPSAPAPPALCACTDTAPPINPKASIAVTTLRIGNEPTARPATTPALPPPVFPREFASSDAATHVWRAWFHTTR